MEITIKEDKYNLHLIDKNNYELYETKLNNTQICGREFISSGYEELTYFALSEDGYIGFFLTDLTNSIFYVFIIFDLQCSQIKDKLSSYESFENTVEIVLICSNSINYVKGLATIFLKKILSEYIHYFMPNAKHILLFVAMRDKNIRAVDFYEKIGFKEIEPNIMKYDYVLGGGKKLRKNTKKKKRKTKKKNMKKTKTKTKR